MRNLSGLFQNRDTSIGFVRLVASVSTVSRGLFIVEQYAHASQKTLSVATCAGQPRECTDICIWGAGALALQPCGGRVAPVPKHDAFHRAFAKLTPATLEAINQQVVLAAVVLGLENGKKLRTQTTVVKPTSTTRPTVPCSETRSVSSAGWAGVSTNCFPGAFGDFTNHRRSARRRMQQIQRMNAQQRHDQLVPTTSPDQREFSCEILRISCRISMSILDRPAPARDFHRQ